jgi:hypothetical protein
MMAARRTLSRRPTPNRDFCVAGNVRPHVNQVSAGIGVLSGASGSLRTRQLLDLTLRDHSSPIASAAYRRRGMTASFHEALNRVPKYMLLPGAACRNRTDDLRITRRMRVVHGRPVSHSAPARRGSRSEHVRDHPGLLLANALARTAGVSSGRGRPPILRRGHESFLIRKAHMSLTCSDWSLNCLCRPSTSTIVRWRLPRSSLN